MAKYKFYVAITGRNTGDKLYRFTLTKAKEFAKIYPDFDDLNGTKDPERWEEALNWIEKNVLCEGDVQCLCY